MMSRRDGKGRERFSGERRSRAPASDALDLAGRVAVAFLDRALRYGRITPALAAVHGSSIEGAGLRLRDDLRA
jgi:hypothetical protein